MTTRDHLINHYELHPKMEIRDMFKYIFQSSFGCEHLVSDEARALAYIKAELCEVTEARAWRVDELDGDYCRVHLCSVGGSLTPEVLTKYFCLSAKTEPNGKTELISKLSILRSLIEDGTLPFSLSEFDELNNRWQEAGYPAIHHSDIFRSTYTPHYRVIARKYIDDLFMLSKSEQIDRKTHFN